MTDEHRVHLNTARLGKVDSTIRREVLSVLKTLEHYGHRPVIHQDVWRDPELQAAKYRRGASRLKWGFHCATRSGKPASLAADIVDCELFWDASRAFWLCLGYAARAQGLGWGGYWGLAPRLQRYLTDAILVFKNFPNDVPEDLKFGWDAAHVETARVTVAEAKRGKR